MKQAERVTEAVKILREAKQVYYVNRRVGWTILKHVCGSVNARIAELADSWEHGILGGSGNATIVYKFLKTKITYTAADWSLYAMRGSERAAAKINRAIENAVNGNQTRSEVSATVIGVMDKLSRFGASDSEPMQNLRCVLDEIFGEGKEKI